MFCPKCGTKNELQQSFCRSCGLELQDVFQSLVKSEGFLKHTEWLTKLGVFTIGLFAGGLICLFSVLVYSSIHLDLGSALVLTMILVAVTFGLLSLTLFDNYRLKRKKNSERENEGFNSIPQIERWNTNKQLNESPAPPPSVVEETTELFYVERIKPKTSGELS